MELPPYHYTTPESYGFFENVPDEIYFQRRLGVASNSLLKLVDEQTLGHYYHRLTHPQVDDETPAKVLGKAFHCLVLEREQFLQRYAIEPLWTSSANSNYGRAERAEFANANDGRIIISAKLYQHASDMRESVLRHKTAALMIERGKREVVMRWIDPETGLECEGKVDLWDEELGYFLDLKSTLSASMRAFGSSIVEFRYHVQHVMYSSGARELGKPIERFFFVPVEKDAPHFSAVRHIDEAGIERGAQLLRRSLDKLAGAMKSLREGNPPHIAFPAYGEGIQPQSLPGWAYAD